MMVGTEPAACRSITAAAMLVLLAACIAVPDTADPLSDAPEARVVQRAPVKDAPSYEDALRLWRSAEDVNAWIGARFEYDMPRALRLSETQRGVAGRLAILAPRDFHAAPRGVCVDLARFGVETLRAIDPPVNASYLMIEFSPVSIGGNTLRRHWMATFARDGQRYFFADSKRPGHMAGPYASTRDFIEEYSRYRGREIVSFRELPSYERMKRTPATRQDRNAAP